MNRDGHIFTAVVTSIILIVVYVFLLKKDLFGLIIYLWPIFIGVIFPDLIEPAIDYTHRQYFHSKRVLKICSIVLIISLPIGFLYSGIWYLTSFTLGYIVHLFGDSITPMGLPD